MRCPAYKTIDSGFSDAPFREAPSTGKSNTALHANPRLPWARLLWYALFAISFGYVEAAVVVYLRRALGMGPGLDYRVILAQRHLSLSSAHFIEVMQREHVWQPELLREAATIFLLLGASFGGGRNLRERCGLFFYTFALWDLSYYVVLTIWIGFPKSLFDIDVYYLIPIAWYGPVWFPVLVVMPALLLGSLRTIRRAQQLSP